MLGKLCHKALAESHNFTVGLALRVKVGAALTAAHRQTCKAVLEYLLEAEELDYGSANGGVKSETALVRSDSGIELAAEAAVHLNVALVVNPRNSELNETLGLNDPVDDSVCLVGLILFNNRLERFQNLSYSLEKLCLAGVALFNLFVHAFKVLVFKCHCKILPNNVSETQIFTSI